MKIDPIDFDQFAALCWQRGSMKSPSELQGFLLGCLAIAEPYAKQDWVKAATEQLDPVEPLDDHDTDLLAQVYDDCCELLQDGNMSVQLLLPDEDVELNQRIECLGFVCQGFLQGFALSGKKRLAKSGKREFSEMVSEALNDIAAIAQVGLTDTDGGDEAERDFMDLAEHVRLAVINVFLECADTEEKPSIKQAVKAQPKLH